MIIREIKISELTTFVNSAEFASWENIPISPVRALSQSQNPDAKPNQIALVIALDDSGTKLLAYAGAFPSKITKKEKIEFAWNSCWWVTEGEGGDAGIKVFIRFLMSWENEVAFSDMTEKTFNIISSLGFCEMFTREGLVLSIRTGFYSRLQALSLSNKPSASSAQLLIHFGIPFLFQGIERLIFHSFRLFKTFIPKAQKPVILDFLETKDFEFISKESISDFFVPDSYALQMPVWLEKRNKSNSYLSKKYYFSSFAESFSTKWLRWESNGKINALAMISIRDGVLKTLYCYRTEEFKDEFPKLFLKYCFSEFTVRTLITSQPELVKYSKENKFFILSRRYFTRYSAISKELLKYFQTVPVLQDGDGDYRFT